MGYNDLPSRTLSCLLLLTKALRADAHARFLDVVLVGGLSPSLVLAAAAP